MTSNKTFNDTALEFMRIYFSCHPKRLPEDPEAAFKEMNRIFTNYKEKLIDKGIDKNKKFFEDMF